VVSTESTIYTVLYSSVSVWADIADVVRRMRSGADECGHFVLTVWCVWGVMGGGMFGKIFNSMYTGSMVGVGPMVFAVWPYVLANMEPVGGVMEVELNPKLMGLVFGCSEEEVAGAIRVLCEPDERSRSKEEGGRRLVKVGEYSYRVVNGMKYRDIRNREERRRADRERKRGVRGREMVGEGGYVRSGGDDRVPVELASGGVGMNPMRKEGGAVG
jgi:hypothetical protein